MLTKTGRTFVPSSKCLIMEVIGIIGAVASVVAAVFVIIEFRYSKVNLIRRIDRKNERIQAIDNKQIRMYGLNGRGIGPMTALDIEKYKLQNEVKELNRYL